MRWLGDWAGSVAWPAGMAAFLLVLLIESRWPARRMQAALPLRWAGHFLFYGACIALTRLTAPGALAGLLDPLGAARPFARLGAWSPLAMVVLALLAFDLLMYAIHRAQHRIFLLWRFHAVHHADSDLDVTSTLRHHPVEYVSNTIVVVLLLAALGVPIWLGPVYNVISLTSGMFQHMNARLPAGLEHRLDLVLLTPGMHRVHHSDDPAHFGSNLGAVLSVWDRLFGTFRRLPAPVQDRVAFGIPEVASVSAAHGWSPWLLPFRLKRPGHGAAPYQS